jgi:hypothetical protein
MDNIIYIGERNRATRLAVGLLERGFDIKVNSGRDVITVCAVNPEDVAGAKVLVGKILDDLYTGV